MGKGTNRDITSGDRRGQSSFFRGGEGDGTFNGFVLSTLHGDKNFVLLPPAVVDPYKTGGKP